jgi:hypothetical protein
MLVSFRCISATRLSIAGFLCISHSTRTEPPNSYIRKNKSANGTSYSTRHPWNWHYTYGWSSPIRWIWAWNSQCSWMSMMSFFMKSLCRTGPQVLMFLQLHDMIRRLLFILFSTSELGVTFVLTGQPLAYAPKPVQVQRNNAINHQPPLSSMDVSSAYPTQHVHNHQIRTSERINLQTAHHIQLDIHVWYAGCYSFFSQRLSLVLHSLCVETWIV